MADQKLTALDLATAVASGDEIYIVQSSTSKRAPLSLLSSVFNLVADESTPLEFANSTDWDFEGKQTAYFRTVPTADKTPVFADITNLRSAVGQIEFTNLGTTDCEFTLDSSWKAGNLPTDVAYASNVLTFTNPGTSSKFTWFIWRVGASDDWYFNIQKIA